MKTIVTYYRGVMRCQFSTQRAKELGKEHRSIFRHIALEPTFELFASEEITEETYKAAVLAINEGPFLRHTEREVVDYYHQDLACSMANWSVSDCRRQWFRTIRPE